MQYIPILPKAMHRSINCYGRGVQLVGVWAWRKYCVLRQSNFEVDKQPNYIDNTEQLGVKNLYPHW